MMQTMASLKTFTPEELFHVLRCCGETLADMYQLTLEKKVWFMSAMAFQASDYLMYEIQKQKLNHYIH